MEPLKNMYNATFVADVVTGIKKYQPSFDGEKFTTLVFHDGWEALELKERMRFISLLLAKTIQGDYPEQVAIINKLAPELAQYKFAQICLPDFIEIIGLEKEEHKAISIAALKHLTQFSSSEFAIRPYIKKYEKEMMKILLEWAKDENYHVRRLASEGCRPRLPWAMALPNFKKNPAPILPILELLKADKEDYVYRSVANNLNDIAKDHPQVVLDTVKQWYGKNKNTDWLVRHACRTLLKQGNTEALMLFGFGNPSEIEVTNLLMTPTSIQIGENGAFQFQLINKSANAAKLRLEFAIYYMKSNGKQNKKVFKISEKIFDGNSTTTIKKKQHFKNLTTRKHYAGAHRISVIVNGVEKAIINFELTK